jgi:hypothetical protein
MRAIHLYEILGAGTNRIAGAFANSPEHLSVFDVIWSVATLA